MLPARSDADDNMSTRTVWSVCNEQQSDRLALYPQPFFPPPHLL